MGCKPLVDGPDLPQALGEEAVAFAEGGDPSCLDPGAAWAMLGSWPSSDHDRRARRCGAVATMRSFSDSWTTCWRSSTQTEPSANAWPHDRGSATNPECTGRATLHGWCLADRPTTLPGGRPLPETGEFRR